ncbi:MAG TPA: CBS domain-containing protein [Acidobacteriota bacterium]
MDATASDLMNREVICLKRDATAKEAAQLFLARGISGAPVVGPDGTLLGVVSLRDLVRENLEGSGEVPAEVDFHRFDALGVRSGFHLEVEGNHTVAGLLTPSLVTVEPDTPLSEVCRLMVEKRIHRVLVSRRARLVGIISTLDILRFLALGSTRGAHLGRAGTADRTDKEAVKS